MSVNAAREVADQLRRIRALAAGEAPVAACRALGQAAETAVKVTLTSFTHQAGTPTPSSPGQPPALVSGDLRRSIQRTPPVLVAAGRADCQVGSRLVYAAVHEFGPVTIRPGASGYLANRKTGQFFVTPYSARQSVTIPRRPYLAPAARKLGETGIALRVTTDAWRAVIDL